MIAATTKRTHVATSPMTSFTVAPRIAKAKAPGELPRGLGRLPASLGRGRRKGLLGHSTPSRSIGSLLPAQRRRGVAVAPVGDRAFDFLPRDAALIALDVVEGAVGRGARAKGGYGLGASGIASPGMAP
jgi:hypothetical protein